jgi:hypothetical protein
MMAGTSWPPVMVPARAPNHLGAPSGESLGSFPFSMCPLSTQSSFCYRHITPAHAFLRTPAGVRKLDATHALTCAPKTHTHTRGVVTVPKSYASSRMSAPKACATSGAQTSLARPCTVMHHAGLGTRGKPAGHTGHGRGTGLGTSRGSRGVSKQTHSSMPRLCTRVRTHQSGKIGIYCTILPPPHPAKPYPPVHHE